MYSAPRVRLGGHWRADKGCPGVLREGTEVAFMRNRRKAVAALPVAGSAAGQYGSASGAGSVPPLGWTDGQEKEQQFQREKLQKRRLEALADGALLPEEIDNAAIAGRVVPGVVPWAARVCGGCLGGQH